MIKLGESIITSQGRVSIPKKVRERLHVQKGDKIALFEDEKGRIVLQEAETPVALSAEDWKAFLAKVEKEPVTTVKGVKAALKHLDRLKKK